MTFMSITILAMFIALAAGAGSCLLPADPKRLLMRPVYAAVTVLLLTIPLTLYYIHNGHFFLFARNIAIDALSLYHIYLVSIVFLLTAIYATGFFKARIESGVLTAAYIKRYCMLWQAFQAALLMVLMSNNVGVMWVSLEATTLVSSFLIMTDRNALSIEAMWKYLLICSVGIVFAFMGTILILAAARKIQTEESVFLFSQMMAHPELIEPKFMLFAFIFIVVGFGTKAGLSPMHTWLPDAHSQAPTPVSAAFSGIMLNCALYCIMRYYAVANAALGNNGEASSILLLLGFASLLFAAIFIPIQTDMKRFLAYCSVEHVGIIAIGLGLGGLGIFAALLHTLSHSLSKILSFYSAGIIGDRYGTRDMRQITAAVAQVPLWGTAFCFSVLVLIGVAPFAIFFSEFLVLKEAFTQGRYGIVGLFLFCVLVIFISALKFVLQVSFGNPSEAPPPVQKARLVDTIMVTAIMILLVVLGCWIPSPFVEFLKTASQTIQSGVGL